MSKIDGASFFCNTLDLARAVGMKSYLGVKIEQTEGAG